MSKKAALLLNLGSPDSARPRDVGRYLKEFLSDARVLDIPGPIRWMLVHLLIVPLRSRRSAEAYGRIWTQEGSPLVVFSRKQQRLVMERAGIPVELAMNYGNPSIASAVRRLVADGADDFFVMPLYPQYGMSSYETVLVKALREIRRLVPGARVAILQPFYNDPAYIDALAVSARAFLSRPFDRLLISFHGVPERHIRKTDSSRAHCLLLTDCCRIAHPVHAVCYRHQCFETARLFAAKAGLSPKRWSVAFQSRLGKDPWLTPGTDREIERLAKEGVKRLLVLCPSFVSDCLETLEEIRIHGTELFVKHGGKSFDQIPCLNDHPQWIEFLADKIRSWRDRAP